MRAGVRRPGVVWVLGEGSIDLWAGGIPLSILRERHAVMGREPPIVAVAWGKPVQQIQQRAFLPGAAGTADQAVGERGGAEHQGVARPGVQMSRQSGKCGFGVARRKQVEKGDMAGFPRGQTGGEGIGRRHRRARRRGVAAFQQQMRPGGMGEGKAGICGDGAIERLDRAGVLDTLFGVDAMFQSQPEWSRDGKSARISSSTPSPSLVSGCVYPRR